MKQAILILTGLIIISCNDEIKEVEPRVIADFTIEIDDLNFRKVHFTNASENAINYSWDFGNGETSTLENPTYTYASEGMYDVTLQVLGAGGNQDSRVRSVVIHGIPEPPVSQLSGEESKTWKLYRVGAAASLGPDPSNPDAWWSGFHNDGTRSCLYKHEFTFYTDQTFEFEDHGGFWGDIQVWSPADSVYESCFEPTANNMMVNGTDLTPWLSGTHSYDFDSSVGRVILRGKGAWIGFPFLGSTSNHGTNLPDSVAFTVSFVQMPTFDLMTVHFDHGEDGFWTFRYVNYEDWQDEPLLIE